LRLLEVHQQRVAHPAHQLGASEKIGREIGHGEERAELGVRLAQAGDQLGERGGVVRVVPKIFAVQQAQFAGHMLVITESKDRGDDDVITFQGELPFLPHVGGKRGLRPADINHQVHLGADGVLDLLMEVQPA
jgi:hypothetical protein